MEICDNTLWYFVSFFAGAIFGVTFFLVTCIFVSAYIHVFRKKDEGRCI